MIKLTKAKMVKMLKDRGCKESDTTLFSLKYKKLKEMLNIPDKSQIKPEKKVRAAYKKKTIKKKYCGPHRPKLKDYEGPYSAIIELTEMLIRAGIPFKFDKVFHGYQVRIKIYYKMVSNNGKIQYRQRWVDAVEHDLSLGNLNNLIEIQGALTRKEFEDSKRGLEMYNCVGNLTAYEVLHRWKYCIKNNTLFYKKGGRK